MGELRFQVSVSLDGYMAGPDQSMEEPLGVGGERLHDWIVELEAWRRMQGMEGGEVNASTPVVEEAFRTSAPRSWAATCSAAGRGAWPDGSALDRLVGRQSAVPSPGLRAHPPRTGPA